jgi:hypothetical protein
MTSPARGRAAATALDADLARSVRRTAYMRQGFYVVVLLVALAGQVSGAVETLHLPLLTAIPAISALELGGVVVLANADVRRRLGESALASRILSGAIAAGAVAFNWLTHADHLLGGFFAGMSALGYLVWLMHTENQRRDRLRATGQLAAVTPAYEVVGHWLAHPWLTRRARALAKADPTLGLYESLDAARAAVRRERREAAIATVLHRKIRRAVDPTTADIAVHVYDLNEIAARLAAGADYAGLTALIAADLQPARIAGTEPPAPAADTVPVDPAETLTIGALGVPVEPVAAILPVPVPRTAGTAPDRTAGNTGSAAVPLADEVIHALIDHPTYVPREDDGSVPIQRAAKRLGIGTGRAKRLLAERHLLRTGGGDQAATDDVPAGVNDDVPADREMEVVAA